MHTKHIWRQADREDAMTAARRTVMEATAALAGIWGLYDATLDRLRHTTPVYARALEPLTTGLNTAKTLLEAYDYHLARCAEAGLSAHEAQAAWETYSTPAWEAEVIEAESYGPNALHVVDEQILRHLGIAPHEDTTVVPDAEAEAD